MIVLSLMLVAFLAIFFVALARTEDVLDSLGWAGALVAMPLAQVVQLVHHLPNDPIKPLGLAIVLGKAAPGGLAMSRSITSSTASIGALATTKACSLSGVGPGVTRESEALTLGAGTAFH